MKDNEPELEQIHQYQKVLEQRILQSSPDQQASLVDFHEELQLMLEELRVANQQLVAANEAIAAEQQRYQNLFEFAPDGCLVTDAHGKIQAVNRAAAQLLGVSQRFLVGKPMSIYVPVEHNPTSFQTQLHQVVAQQERQEWLLVLRPRSGALLHASVHVAPVHDPINHSLTLRWSLRDVTQQVQVEKKLQKTLCFEATLRSLTEQVRSSLDEPQILQTVVQQLVEVLGLIGCDAGLYDLEQGTSMIQYEYAVAMPEMKGQVIRMAEFPEGYGQLLGGQWFQFCEPLPSLRRAVTALACPIHDRHQVFGDLWLFKPKGEWFEESEIQLVEQVAHQCAIAIRQSRLYQKAQTQVEALQELNQLKDDFLSTVSHELRTPITNMQMALHMLKVTSDAERRERYMQILQNECDREAELIKNLLDLQSIRAGAEPKRLAEALDLREWLLPLLESWAVRMQDRQQHLQVTLPDTRMVLIGDRANLERLLTELLNNAYKYTPKGGKIEVAVSADAPTEQSQPASAWVTFTIRNSTQIAAAHLPLIFDRFYRIPNNDPWSQGGTGLGLALVKSLVEGMQGTIQADSQDGWTVFTVRLPQSEFPPN